MTDVEYISTDYKIDSVWQEIQYADSVYRIHTTEMVASKQNYNDAYEPACQ